VPGSGWATVLSRLPFPRILVSATIALRYRIALEQDASAGFEDADWLDGAERRGERIP
jgi:hypothetical protein